MLDRGDLRYDYLIVAAGAQNHYFGHDDWAKYAVGLKDIDDAVEVRRRVLWRLKPPSAPSIQPSESGC